MTILSLVALEIRRKKSIEKLPLSTKIHASSVLFKYRKAIKIAANTSNYFSPCVCCVFSSVLSCFCISKTCFNSTLYTRQTDFRFLERKETWTSKYLLFLPWLIFSLPVVFSFPLSKLQPGLESVGLYKQPLALHIFSSLSFLLLHKPTAQTTNLKLKPDAFSQKHLTISQGNTSNLRVEK